MDFDTLLEDSLEKIKCSSCSNYLSYFPITICDGKLLCGRCPSTDVSIRNAPFETLAQFLPFPCRYQSQGCLQELLPQDIPEHENNCKFRVVPCLLTESVACEWSGPRCNVLHHCKNTHSDFVLNNGEFEFDLSKSHDVCNILEHEKSLLIFHRKFMFDLKVLYFGLYTPRYDIGMKQFSCQLEVKCGDKRLINDFNSSYEEDFMFTELGLESLRSNLNVPTATAKVTVVKEEKGDIDLDMLALLKCSVCSCYAVPPVYHCSKDSNILCNECKPKHQPTCSTCSNLTAPFRNINVDKIATVLTYPCRFSSNGCTVTAKAEKILYHHTICQFANLLCPFDELHACAWKGVLPELKEHIRNEHQDIIPNLAEISKHLTNDVVKYDIIKFTNNLFRLAFLKRGNQYLFTVQVVGPCQDNRFKFEIEIFDLGKKGKRLLATKYCTQLTSSNQLFQNSDHYCVFVEEQINDFLLNQVINFKVRVF